MKALVLSGGAGTRLRPFSYSMPKQLIPIANKPVLAHVIDNIRSVGVTEIAVVVGEWGPEIMAEIGDGTDFGAEVTYLYQESPLGLAHCVRLARDFLGDDDFLMYLGDNVLADGIEDMAADFREGRPAAHLAVQRVPDQREFGTAELTSDGSVRRLVEKPAEFRSGLALIGVYFFTSAVHEGVDAIAPSARGELEITDAVQWLVDSGAVVRATEYRGYWKDTGRAEDVLACNRRLLEDLAPSVEGEVDSESELLGNVVVGPGARVVRSRVEGPVIVGAGSLVTDSRIGPHASIGRDCFLDRTELSNSIVLDGASISSIPGLSGSLIGRSASVGLGRAESHHSLVVGDHVRIEMTA